MIAERRIIPDGLDTKRPGDLGGRQTCALDLLQHLVEPLVLEFLPAGGPSGFLVGGFFALGEADFFDAFLVGV